MKVCIKWFCYFLALLGAFHAWSDAEAGSFAELALCLRSHARPAREAKFALLESQHVIKSEPI